VLIPGDLVGERMDSLELHLDNVELTRLSMAAHLILVHLKSKKNKYLRNKSLKNNKKKLANEKIRKGFKLLDL